MLTVKADGYAPAVKEVRIPPGTSLLHFQLGPGGTIQGRVVDRDENPIKGATVTARKWGGYTFNAADLWRGRTDSEGRFVWTEAPQDQIEFVVFESDYLFGHHTMSPSEEEYIVTLMPAVAIKISGTVSDVQTGGPIERFRAIPVSKYHPGHGLSFISSNAKVCTGGWYEFSRTSRTPYTGQMIAIEAEGYRVAVSAPLNIEEGELVYNFKLHKAADSTDLIGLPGFLEQAKVKNFLSKVVCVDESYAESMLKKLSEESRREGARGSKKNNSFEGQFKLEVDIPVNLEAGTRENPAIFRLKTIRFEKSHRGLRIILARRIITWPSLECSTKIEILDSEGQVIGTMRLADGNGGIKIGAPFETHPDISFYWEPRIDFSGAKEFKVTIQPRFNQKAAVLIETEER